MILYEKKGRRYYPVRDTEAFAGLGIGAHVVVVEKRGSSTLTTIHKLVVPAHAELLAAISTAREAMLHAMIEKNTTTKPARPLSPKEKKAWEAYRAVMNEDRDVPMLFAGVSMHDVIDAGIRALEEKLGIE